MACLVLVTGSFFFRLELLSLVLLSFTSQCFCLRQLLHLQPSPYTERMNERELASLLYRDHVGLKHASRDRLGKEIADAQTEESTFVNASVPEHDQNSEWMDPLTSAMLGHLVQAGV